MSVRFEDHPGFQRAALWSAAGGAALGAFGMLPLAVAGSAAGIGIACAGAGWRNRILAAAACAVTAILWMVAPHSWSPWACGATLGLLLAAVRAGSAQAAGDHPPSPMAVALTGIACAAAVALGAEVLLAVSAALAIVAPGWIAASLSGGLLGLWAAACAAPLHVALEERVDPAGLGAAEELSREIDRYLRTRA